MAFRIPDELAERIEQYRQTLATRSPWTSVTTTDAVVMLLEAGLSVSCEDDSLHEL